MVFFPDFLANVLVGELQREGPMPLSDPTAHYWPPWGPLKLFIFASIWSEVRADVTARMFFFGIFQLRCLLESSKGRTIGLCRIRQPIISHPGDLSKYLFLLQFGLR